MSVVIAQPERNIKLDTTAILLFSLSSGATDAFVFLTFGGIFTANMTGNMVLMGMFTRPLEAVTLAALAVVAFAIALYFGFRLMKFHDERGIYHRVPVLLWISVVLQVIVVTMWILIYGAHAVGNWGTYVLIGFSAAVHALQTAGAKRLPAAKGSTTTYMTGTMTSLLEDVVYKRKDGRASKIGSIACLIGGAVAGTAVIATAPIFGPVLPLVAGTTAVVLTWFAVKPASQR